MIIKLSPVRSDAELTVSKTGDVLKINGASLDFSRLVSGETLPAAAVGCEFIIAPIERAGSDLIVTLMLPHSADAPEAVRFPDDLNPADGPIHLPGIPLGAAPAATPGVIDWSQLITVEMKAQAAAGQLLAQVQAETALRRAAADSAIAPLQDAVDIEEATDAESALLKDWKRYRVALNRLPDQPGYPAEIDWPAPPA